MEQEDKLELFGRKRIYTDEFVIDKDNVIKVLNDALVDHLSNITDISYLLQYEKGNQPLQRKKTVRPDIDIQVCDNIANEVTEFKLSYNWGNPIEIVQRSDLFPTADKTVDDNAITLLNNMLKSEYKNTKDQELARYVEITGIGYRLVDFKRNPEPNGALFDIQILNPMFAFVVYSNDVYRRPMMGVTYCEKKNGDRYFTCYTNTDVFYIKNAIKIVNDKKEIKSSFYETTRANILGMVNVIEYNRSTDRMGCFERQISDMDNINILVSDFTNDVAQNTQAIWHANDVEFPIDETTGNPKTPVSNQWACTNTTRDGKTPFIRPMSSEYNYNGMLDNIKYRHDRIMEKCSVPLRSEPGGGSTGTAMSMSSGWTDAECAANKEALIIEQGELSSLKAILSAIKNNPFTPVDSILNNLSVSDLEVHFIRNKTYDMATKANSYATFVGHGINQRDALTMVDATSNIESVVTNSRDDFEKYQESAFKSEKTDARMMSDLSDQVDNSPITGSI